MAKTVFGSHDQTAHVWAQARYPYGRSGDSRMFWEGRVLYSYGRHFALGLVVTNPAGEPVATILNSAGYSPSTGKHKSHARGAARGRIVHVPSLSAVVATLEYVTGRDKPAKVFKGSRQADELAEWIAKHHAALTPESAAYIWGLVGGTEKQAAAMLAKAAKAAKAKAEKEAKAELKLTLGRAAEVAALTPAGFMDWVRSRLGRYPYEADYRAKAMLKELRVLHRAASKAGKAKQKAAIWGHIGRMAAVPAVMVAKLADKHQSRRGAVRTVRAYLANASAPEPANLTARQWRDVYDAAYGIAGFVATTGTLCAAMTALAIHAEEQRAITAERETEEANAAYEARQAERRKSEQERRESWFAGNVHSDWRGKTVAGGVYLRAVHVEVDGLGAITGTLQTSAGAEVPLAHALRAFRFLKLCHDKGQAWESNGRTIPVGHFRIDRVAPNGDLHAGCHFIEWEQVDTLAKALGVDGWEGDESAVVATSHA